jgi:hypothetical protein
LAGLGQLRAAMGASIFLVAFIFASFLALILFIVELYVIQFSLFYAIALIVVLPVIFILFQYLIGPAIVRLST